MLGNFTNVISRLAESMYAYPIPYEYLTGELYSPSYEDPGRKRSLKMEEKKAGELGRRQGKPHVSSVTSSPKGNSPAHKFNNI